MSANIIPGISGRRTRQLRNLEPVQHSWCGLLSGRRRRPSFRRTQGACPPTGGRGHWLYRARTAAIHKRLSRTSGVAIPRVLRWVLGKPSGPPPADQADDGLVADRCASIRARPGRSGSRDPTKSGRSRRHHAVYRVFRAQLLFVPSETSASFSASISNPSATRPPAACAKHET